MDPFPPTFSPKPRRSFRPQHQMHDLRTAVSEIYASTKPYPSWWSDLEDSRVLQRKKSMGDIVLERNLCFIDTPATSMNQAEQTEAIIQYMHHQLSRAIAALDSSNVDFQSMLAGNGGSQVDTTIYLISQSRLSSGVFDYPIANVHLRYSWDGCRMYPETLQPHKCHSSHCKIGSHVA